MKSIKMILLSALLLLWVFFKDQSEGSCHSTTPNGNNINGANYSWNRENESCTPPCWIGLNNCTSQNGSLFKIANISTNLTEQICCGAVNNGTTWGCANCNSTQMYFICSDDNYTLISPNKTWFREFNSSGQCSYMTRSLYKTNENEYAYLCYKTFIHMSRGRKSWEAAMDYCNDSGPLVIQSENDQNETERELRRRNITGPVWVGLRQSRLFGFWIWTNGVHVGPWSNWTGGTAPEHQISQHCGALVKVDDQYKLTDKDCASKLKVLCEIHQ